jgi:hypothetical protein
VSPPRPSKAHWFCEVCEAWQAPLRPHWAWRAAEVSAWVLIPALVVVASKGPGLVLLPVAFLMGAAVFGPLRVKSRADARCPVCNRYIFPPSRAHRVGGDRAG